MSAQEELSKIADDVARLASLQDGQLLLAILQGPIVNFFDNDKYEDKQALEEEISGSLAQLENHYGLKPGKVEAYFSISLKLMNTIKNFKTREEKFDALVTGCELQSLGETASEIFAAMEAVYDSRDDKEAKLEELMGQIHTAQLIGFDYTFAMTTQDSMLHNSGRVLVNLKLDLLMPSNERKSHYIELSLPQFYKLYHELKRAHNLMGGGI